ncbi:hypothetical protein L1987_22640 [Smallanthus sonchifolius]|uniref:Uncharacterized protein n=1 Tax=Smallanthus sonchifolius TaxID=185202 RepID=A0ACB9IGW3_9ASTR|nr:hypothetical protein L1987_22640 [Smallanthus sonchifolius]
MVGRRGGSRGGGHTGRRGRPPGNQRQNDEESVHGDSVDPQNDSTETPSVENHGEQFSFEPEVKAALACEMNQLLLTTLPTLLTDALKAANLETGRNAGAGPVVDSEDEEGGSGPTYGYTYKGLRDLEFRLSTTQPVRVKRTPTDNYAENLYHLSLLCLAFCLEWLSRITVPDHY